MQNFEKKKWVENPSAISKEISDNSLHEFQENKSKKFLEKLNLF